MKNSFQVRLLKFSTLQAIEAARTARDYSSLLDAMDFGESPGMSADELREMCLMSMQDLGPVEATRLVLRHDLGNVLKDSQINHLASEMLDEKLWEEYADISLHEGFFNAGSLLYAAFPQSFPEPDAVHVVLEVVAVNGMAKDTLAASLNESFLVRLLADGMDDSSVLHRLFDKQLNGKSFPEADHIVWIWNTETIDPNTVKIGIISSGYWLDAMKNTKTYESGAYADES